MADSQLPGLSRTTPYLAFGGKIKQHEVDQYQQYCVLRPGISGSAIVATTAGTATAGTIAINYPDYPRNLSMTYVEASGTAAIATVSVDGHDQFGNVINESFVMTNLGTATTNGTKVFAYVGTVTFTGSGRASGDDMSLGYCSADGTTKFGLPSKVSGSADVLRYNWLDNTASKQGTCTVDTTFHAVVLATGTVSNQDDHIFLIKAEYLSDDNEMCKLTNATTITNA